MRQPDGEKLLKEEKMFKQFHKGAVMMILLMGVLLVSTAPTALAQKKYRDRRPQQVTYYDDRYDDRYDNRYNNRYNNRYDNRRDDDNEYRNDWNWRRNREDTTGKALKRTGIGAAIGAGGGALIGGKKGALIGAGVGAVGGYIYHKQKVNRERDRRWPW